MTDRLLGRSPWWNESRKQFISALATVLIVGFLALVAFNFLRTIWSATIQ